VGAGVGSGGGGSGLGGVSGVIQGDLPALALLGGERRCAVPHPLPVTGLTGTVAEMNTGTAMR
jgi:hypothetical protein